MVKQDISKPPRGKPPLPLSLTETGALATAPLSTVVNAATDDLYQDIYNLVHSDIKIVSVANSNATANNTTGGGEGDNTSNTAGANNSSSTATTSAGENAVASVEEKLTAAALGVNDSSTNNTTTNTTNTNPSNPNDSILETRKQRMSNLSFAQRRHELTRRIVQHTKSIAHVYALTASSLPKSHSAILQQNALKNNHTSSLFTESPSTTSTGVKIFDPPPRLGATVQVSSDALQYVKSGWVSQDEAQDALYFHHDGLWKARSHCHDVLGALCVLSTPAANESGVKNGGDDMEIDTTKVGEGGGGRWPDFPTDVALAVDRYETSNERAYSTSELQARLASAVRRKLVLGEVGACKSGDKHSHKLPWRVILGKGGGSIRLTYSTPRTVSTAEALRQQSVAADDDTTNTKLQQYPIEAKLSVLNEDPSTASWKLLSIHVNCSPKTGESDHQLVLNKKQMFDLHRIGERCMIVEEAVCRKMNEEAEATGSNGTVSMSDEKKQTPVVPRPLYRLFEVAHAFALSLQMEILSSQAEALRRGAWGGSSSTGGKSSSARGGHTNECIQVSPVHFFTGNSEEGKTNDDEPAPIAVMAVHFWSCDDRYGSPRVGDLSDCKTDEMSSNVSTNTPNQRQDDNFLPKSDNRGNKRLSLCIRAVPTVGLVVSLSGGSGYENDDDTTTAISHHMKRNADKLLSSIQDSFQLSMSDALLAATVLCADRRCQAVVTSLNKQKINKLPGWIHLEVECGTISVAAVITYPTSSKTTAKDRRTPTVLFRLACDSRSGRFLPIFPRPASLLRLLACNDPSSSDVQSLRNASMASAFARSGGTIKRGVADIASRESTGRIVRDAFDALSRSMDTLGRKCGVGGLWNDIDAQSVSLREKSINQTCHDVRASLITCSGIASVFGVGTIGLKIAGGIDPVVDVAGGIIDSSSNSSLLRIPPLSVLLRQTIVEKVVKEGDGETKRISQLQGELFALSAKVTNDTLNLVCFDVLTISESASAIPTRLEIVEIEPPKTIPNEDLCVRPLKKARTTKTEPTHHTLEEVEHATLWLDTLIRQ